MHICKVSDIFSDAEVERLRDLLSEEIGNVVDGRAIYGDLEKNVEEIEFMRDIYTKLGGS